MTNLAIAYRPVCFTLDRKRFESAMVAACKIVERRNRIPVLAAVKIASQTGRGLTITATDLDICSETHFPEYDGPAFAALVNADKVMKVLRKAKACDSIGVTVDHGSETVALDIDGMIVSYKADVPASDFPVPSERRYYWHCRFRSDDLFKILRTVSIAVSTEGTRYYLCGVHMHAHLTPHDGNTLRFVATDGHRLMCQSIPLPLGMGDVENVIIPSKTIAEVQRLVKGTRSDPAPEFVEFSGCRDGVRFTIGKHVITSKLIDGKFPDYQRVIPSHDWNEPHAIAFDRKQALTALEKLSTIASERGRKVILTATADNLRLEVHNPDTGTAHVDLVGESDLADDAERFIVGYNSGYLTSMLKTMESDIVVIAACDESAPARIHDGTRSDLIAVQMPMRI